MPSSDAGFDSAGRRRHQEKEGVRGGAQGAQETGESRFSLFASVSVSAEENGRTRSQTKAREIKGKWDRTLLRGAIVQYISRSQESLLGMPGPCYSNMARNPIIEQTPAVKAAKRREHITFLLRKIVSTRVSTPRTKVGETSPGCLKRK